MKILDININDFGGTFFHLEEYKKIYRNGYLKRWDDLDKSQEINGILDCIESNSPDIVVMQEYDINSKEAKYFENKMESNGYELKSELTRYQRPSMTIFFIKKALDYAYVSVGHTKNGRAYAIKTEDTILYGTHIPPKYDKQFWQELHDFVAKHKSEKFLLIGDFNTINYKNMEELRKLIFINNAIDVWKEKGNEKPISDIGDFAIISNSIELDKVDIDSFDDGNTDHPVIVVSIE